MSAATDVARMIRQSQKKEASRTYRTEAQTPKTPARVVFLEAELAHRGIGTQVNTTA